MNASIFFFEFKITKYFVIITLIQNFIIEIRNLPLKCSFIDKYSQYSLLLQTSPNAQHASEDLQETTRKHT